ncbi:MAG: TolC family protein [Chitinophagaceae bacterium]|nr:TolC family protein [Chitinophagaceae bacterium]
MLNTRSFILALPLFVSGILAYGQQSSPVITLTQMLERVQLNAPSLMADSAAIGIKKAQFEASRYNWWPSLRLNYQIDVGTNNNLPGGYFSYGIVPSNSRVRQEGNASTILTNIGIASFDWEIYNFGAYEARQQVAESDLKVEQSGFERSRYSMQVAAIDHYLQLIQLGDMMQIQSRNIIRNQEIKRIIHALAVAGIKAGVDTSIAEAELSRARLIELELSNQMKKNQLRLSYISGINTEKIVPDTLLEDRLISRYASFLMMDPDTASHPLLLYYKALHQNSLDKEAWVQKMYMPKVALQAAIWGRGSSVSASDEFRALSKGMGFERGNYLLGVGVTYNIFDNKRKKLQLKTQQAGTEYALKKLGEQEAEMAVALQQAQVELTTAYSRLLEIPRQLEAANAAYRQKLSLYRNGLTNIVELNTALSILYRAETDYTLARYMFCKALFQKAMVENQLPLLLQTLN